MAYEVLDNRNNTDLEKGFFATLSAIKGTQFGRDVYSTMIKFKDLADFLEIFPDVQRDIIPRKVASIRRYIMTEEDNLRFFSSITVSCKGYVLYDEVNKRLALDVANTKLSINDGQHRFEAVKSTLQQLENDFQKSKDKKKTEKIREKINRLEQMVLPVVIFNGLTEREEKQLFHDLNNLAQRPSKSANIKLNQTDFLSRLARDISEQNEFMVKYGVEKEKSSIHQNNPNTILLTTVYNSVKLLFKSRENTITEENYNEFLQEGLQWFDDIFGALPKDIDTKGKYILDKGYGFTSIFRFIATMNEKEVEREKVIKTIDKSDFRVSSKEWTYYGGTINKFGRIEFTGGSNGGYRAIYKMLMDKSRTIK